ncbi:MAG: hypothetical protein JSR64_17090 [Nitrospira sp.]|nr:hypothetical protein [Nitrospira sp.]
MPAKKTANPLTGLSPDQIRELIETADVTEDDGDTSEGIFEIVIRGKDSKTVLEHLGIITDKTYDPEEESEKDEKDEKEPKRNKSLADRLLGSN